MLDGTTWLECRVISWRVFHCQSTDQTVLRTSSHLTLSLCSTREGLRYSVATARVRTPPSGSLDANPIVRSTWRLAWRDWATSPPGLR